MARPPLAAARSPRLPAPALAAGVARRFQPAAGARFLAVRDSGALVGLISLLVTDRTVSFLGDPSICDYMDFAFSAGHEEEVVAASLDALLAEGHRAFDFWGLREGSPSLTLLPQLAEARGLHVRLEDEAVCPQLDLPPTWDQYLQLLSGKNRHELRRKQRRSKALSARPNSASSARPTSSARA